MTFPKTDHRIAAGSAEVNRLKGIFVLCALLSVFWMTVHPLEAFQTELGEGPVTIEADRIAYDADEDTFHASGNVLITFTGGSLKADDVILKRAANQALASGHVLVHSDQDTLEGEKVLFKIDSRTGTVESGKMFIAQNHFYVQGERIEKKSEATYRLENATVTTCDGETPDWSIAGSELDLTIDGYGVLRNGRFLVRDWPLLFTPYLIFPVKTTRQTGLLLPRFAHSRDKNGLDVEIPFYWAASDSVDATFFQRYLEKRGFKEGLEVRYFTSPETFGVFYGDFIYDHKRVRENVGTMSRDWDDDRSRWSYYFNHETSFGDGFGLRTDIRRVSDHWYFRDFSSFNYYRDHYSPSGEERFRRVSFFGDESLAALDSTVRLTKDWSLYNLTALARYTDDFTSTDNRSTLQKYPEAVLKGFRQPLFNSPLQLEFDAGYGHFYREEGQRGHLWEISPTLYLPYKLGSRVQMVSQAGVQWSAWERSDSAEGSGDKRGDREIFTVGATLSTDFFRVYDVQGENVEKIRHGIRPEITYTFIPETSQDLDPDFLDRVPAQNAVNYGVTNTLLARMRTKDGKVGYREMMRLKLGQTYDIQEARRDSGETGKGNRPFRDVELELDLSPFPYLSLSARNKFDVNAGNWRQNNYDLTLFDHRGDSVSAGYRYTRDTLEEINLYLKAALTPSLGATYVLRRNQLDRKTIESTCGLQYRRQCWNVELSVSDLDDDRTVMLVWSLYGMGK